MNLEHAVIAAMGVLVALVLALVLGQQDAPSLVTLEQINLEAKEARAGGDEARFLKAMSVMRQRIALLASYELGVPISDVYLEEGFNFPFVDASEVKIRGNASEQMPACDIIPKIPTHLQKVRQNEMFQMFVGKYGAYQLELTIQDERSYKSTVHYTLAARSGNVSASTFFHINSCSDRIDADYYNLHCYDWEKDEHTDAIYKGAVAASLESDEFCTIELEPWRQALSDYGFSVQSQLKTHLQSLSGTKPDHKAMEEFYHEAQRLDSLGSLVAYAMGDKFEVAKMEEMIRDYEDKFGPIPEEFLELADRK